ncbi:hypothetical protein VTK56DRAFT_3138 [Thermocarpiscus australiensis]
MSGRYDHHGQGQVPPPYLPQQYPRTNGDSFHQVKGPSGPFYSWSSGILNGRSAPPPLPRSPPRTQASVSPRQETKSMSISNLLSSDTTKASNVSSPFTASKQPMPPTAAPRTPMSEYRLSVRQQPSAARSCGFGERDRRVIDPPPIVQLTVHANSECLSQDEVAARRLRHHQFSVVHCSIWDDKGAREHEQHARGLPLPPAAPADGHAGGQHPFVGLLLLLSRT